MATDVLPGSEGLQADLAVLAEQERVLRFDRFSPETAWQVGSRLRASLLGRQASGTVEIEIARQLVFACATAGAGQVAIPGQANWIRRKRNTVHHFAQSTYAVGRRLERDGGDLLSRHGLSEIDFAAHGGGFPVIVRGTGMVGSVILSGLPQRDDHNLVVEALAAVLEIVLPGLPA